MAFQTIPGGAWIPHPPGTATAVIILDDIPIAVAAEEAAGVFRAGKAGTISKVGFLVRTSTTGDTVDVRLETVDLTDGDPSDTELGTDSSITQVISTTDDTWYTVTLETPVVVTKGQLMAVTIVQGAVPGVFDIAKTNFRRDGFPYIDLFSGASWAKSDNSPVFSLEYDDGSYAVCQGVFPFKSIIHSYFYIFSY